MYLEGQNMYSMNNSYLLYPQNYQTIVQSQYPLAFRGEGSLKPQLETPVQPRGINQTALLTTQSVPSFQGAANAIKTLPNDTVEIDGTDVSRASLHNLTILKEMNVRKNCSARVFKANMIIPQVYCELVGFLI